MQCSGWCKHVEYVCGIHSVCQRVHATNPCRLVVGHSFNEVVHYRLINIIYLNCSLRNWSLHGRWQAETGSKSVWHCSLYVTIAQFQISKVWWKSSTLNVCRSPLITSPVEHGCAFYWSCFILQLLISDKFDTIFSERSQYIPHKLFNTSTQIEISVSSTQIRHQCILMSRTGEISTTINRELKHLIYLSSIVPWIVAHPNHLESPKAANRRNTTRHPGRTR